MKTIVINNYHYRKIKNKIMLSLIFLPGIMVMIPLVMIFLFVLKNGMSSLSWEFLTNLPKPVGEPGGGMMHALMGTIFILLMGSFIGVLWGLGAGVYLSEYGRGQFASCLRFATDLLSGTPSIVIGLFVYTLLVLPFKSFSALAGGVALALIILPVVIRTTEEVLKLVPQDVREAGLALGLSRFKVILHIIIFGSRNAILTGVLLSMGRAAGETAPLLFTTFGNMNLNLDPLKPMAALPLQIYQYAISPYDEWRSQAWAGAFVLMMLVFTLNITAKFITNFSVIKEYIFLTWKALIPQREKKNLNKNYKYKLRLASDGRK